MDWTWLAILSSITLGLVSNLDSHLMGKRLPSLRAYVFPLGAIYLVYGLLLIALFPLRGLTPELGLIALGVGLARCAAVAILLNSLKDETVSRVIPLFFIYPIFVALMAAPLLGESLRLLQWFAIFIVVGGALLVSLGRETGAIRIRKVIYRMPLASLLFAVSEVGNKYMLGQLSFWNVFSTNALCIGVAFLLTSARSATWNEMKGLSNRNSTLALLFFNEALAPIGILLSVRAMASGPVSLVSALLASRPIFVVIFALLLGLVFPDFLIREKDGKFFALGLLATAMIVGGVAIIYLT